MVEGANTSTAQILPSIVASVSGFGMVIVGYFLIRMSKEIETLRKAYEMQAVFIEKISGTVTRIEGRADTDHDAITRLAGQEEYLAAGKAEGRAEAQASQASDDVLKTLKAANVAENIIQKAENKAVGMLQRAEEKAAEKLTKRE